MKTRYFILAAAAIALLACPLSSMADGIESINEVNKTLSVPYSSCTLKIKTDKLNGGGSLKHDEFRMETMVYTDGKEKTRATYRSGRYRGREVIFFFDREKSDKSVQIGRGNEWYRYSGVGLGDPFGRTALRLINLGILEDAENYVYESLGNSRITGKSGDPEKTFYDTRIIELQRQDDGSLVEKSIECLLNNNIVTTIVVQEFAKVGRYWKPAKASVIDHSRGKISLLEFTGWKVSESAREPFFKK